MRCVCPYCFESVVQAKNRDGPNFCANCHKLFWWPNVEIMPPWILGVLVILTANWSIMCHC